ncbi:MAG TPA: hypothetical protein VHM89_01470 [Acidimicrobiales bacterium]|nr:hypothetical protein [Acidimicrobiales bacterium]
MAGNPRTMWSGPAVPWSLSEAVERFLVALVVAVAAVVVARVVDARRPAPPTQSGVRSGWAPPGQLDRADFDGPARPWLVAVFTSATCESCKETTAKARVLGSDQVSFQEISWQDDRQLHDRYDVEVVPCTLIADSEGVVHAAFVGAPSATDLWAALAEARSPGVSPEPGIGRDL